jgi:hypothetical protein
MHVSCHRVAPFFTLLDLAVVLHCKHCYKSEAAKYASNFVRFDSTIILILS